MGLLDRARNWLLQPIYQYMDIGSDERQRLEAMEVYRKYADGQQRSQLPVKFNKPDDNIVVNISNKVIDKSVAMLVGGPLKFDLGEDAPEDRMEWLDSVWEDNFANIFLKKLTKTGAIYGTSYIKIIPDGTEDMNPRLMSLPPMQMRVHVNETDCEDVLGYEQKWLATNDKGKTVVRRERTERVEGEGDTVSWLVTVEEEGNGRKWVELERVEWPYEFPPIVHGQNLPVDNSPYGESDLDNIIGLQDRVNYVASNISKIIRYHAHPRTIGKGFSVQQATTPIVEGQRVGSEDGVGMSGDQMFIIPSGGSDANVWNLEMQSDLASSMNYLNFLINSAYDLSATVNNSNVKDKMGQLTNFALRVMYQDALEKLQSKRDLYGAMLTEVNRRLLRLKFGEDVESGGLVVWPPDVLPQNGREEAEELGLDLGNGLVSKQTAAGLRGYNWEQEQARMTEEQSQQTGELGAQLLRAFNQGQ